MAASRQGWFKGLVLVSVAACATLAVAQGQKVIKDPAEYNAYMAALNMTDPAQKAIAMEAFVQQYPSSIVKIDALEQALAAFQQAGNQPKVEQTAGRLLEVEPANVRALAILTFLTRAKAAQGDAKAAGDVRGLAERGIQALPQWQKPEGTSDAEFDKLKNQMATIFHGAAGFGALQAKDFATARGFYLKSVAIDPTNMQDVYQLAVACLEANPIEKDGFWYIARAYNLAAGNAPAQKGIAAYGGAKYRRYHGNNTGWDDLLAKAATQTALPDGFAASITAAPTEAELAVAAVKENDPATLSFSDWEFILARRDASPANKEAADKVWAAIRAKEQGGQAKLAIPVKVISATKETIQAAITEENQKAGKPDLQVTMEKPLAQLPAAGAQITVIGVITEYTPEPFMFVMNEGELKAAAPARPAPKAPKKGPARPRRPAR